MANIRNHDSWVHADDPDAATEKAKDPGSYGGGQSGPFESPAGERICR